MMIHARIVDTRSYFQDLIHYKRLILSWLVNGQLRILIHHPSICVPRAIKQFGLVRLAMATINIGYVTDS